MPRFLHKDNANTVLSLLALAVSIATLYLTYFNVERELLVRLDTLQVINQSVRLRFVFLNVGNRPSVVLTSALEPNYPLPGPLRDPRNRVSSPFVTAPETTPPYALKDAVIGANGIAGAEAGVWVYPKEAYESGTDVAGSPTGERRGIQHYLRLRVIDDQGRMFESRHFIGEIGMRPVTPSDKIQEGATLILGSGRSAGSGHTFRRATRCFAKRMFSVLSNTIENEPPPHCVQERRAQPPETARSTP